MCPAAQLALRELADRGRRPATARALVRYPDAELLAIADQHTGEHRCRRCGVAYNEQVRSCPTYRRVRAELESRGVMPIASSSASSASDGLCAGRAGGWSVDETVNPSAWRAAMDTCARCPLLARCRADLDARLAQDLPPREQIIAGMLFTPKGRIVTRGEVSRYALTRGRTDRTRVSRASHGPATVTSIRHQSPKHAEVAA